MTNAIETIEHQGELYYRIDPETINYDAMTRVQKVTNVFAWQVPEDKTIEITTQNDEIIETTNTAYSGDWIVYNIGNAEGSLQERLEHADAKVITHESFKKLYAPSDENDGTNFTDYNVITQHGEQEGHIYHYIGKAIYAARAPFNFVIRAPWNKDQFIKKGGYIIYNTNTSNDRRKDVYGTAGGNNRKAGQMENTYTMVGDGDDRCIRDVYKYVIMADRSPIAGIQFNMKDLERAYDMIGKTLSGSHKQKKQNSFQEQISSKNPSSQQDHSL